MKKLVSLGVSAALLAVILFKIDREALWATISTIHLWWFGAGLLFFIPQKLVQGRRWVVMVEPHCRIGLGEAIKLILAGDALNLVLPSKAGDLSKAIFLRSQGRLAVAEGLNLVVFEKLLDLASLCALLLVGVIAARRFDAIGLVAGMGALAVVIITALALYIPLAHRARWDRVISRLPEKGPFRRARQLFVATATVTTGLAGRGRPLGRVIGQSATIWILHLLQIYCFFMAVRVAVPFFDVMALVPVAIFIGLLPLTIAGIGTRDAALIFLFAPWAAAPVMEAVALLTHLRYLVPGLAGLPFFQRYFESVRSWRRHTQSSDG